DELVLIRPLQRRLLVELDRGRGRRKLAEMERAAGRLVCNLAHCRRALGRGHVPALRGCRDQAFARARAGLLDHLAGLAHCTAATGREAPVDLVVLEIAIGRSVFRLDESPIAFELFSENLWQGGEAPLPHL